MEAKTSKLVLDVQVKIVYAKAMGKTYWPKVAFEQGFEKVPGMLLYER